MAAIQDLYYYPYYDHGRHLFHLSPGDQFRQPVANRSNLFATACPRNSDRASANITTRASLHPEQASRVVACASAMSLMLDC
jgi:hypothetical protein